MLKLYTKAGDQAIGDSGFAYAKPESLGQIGFADLPGLVYPSVMLRKTASPALQNKAGLAV
jgi:hypothetical protein